MQMPYRRLAWPWLAFGGLHLAYLAVPSNLGFEWYFAPLYITLNLLVALGMVQLITRWQRGATV